MVRETNSTTLTSIDSTGLLNNEYPGEPSITYECRMFRHAIKKTIGDDYVKTVKWELEGTIPLEVKIDNNGVIEGHVDILDYQPACQDQVTPTEKMKIDGSNWTAGRFQGSVFRFNMVAKWTFEYIEPGASGGGSRSVAKTKTLRSGVYIDVYLDNDITNLAFCKRYLEAEESIITGPILEQDRIEKHYFNLNSKNFSIREFQEFIKEHPGPFAKCNIKPI